MKALIRQENEVILETTVLRFIDWSTGAPLTNPAWAGGPYTLVNNYIPGSHGKVVPDTVPDTIPDTIPGTAPDTVPGTVPDTVPDSVVIDGVTFTRAP